MNKAQRLAWRKVQEALREFRSQPIDQPIDIVILDLNPRNESAWETVQYLTALQPNLPVIAMTARLEEHDSTSIAPALEGAEAVISAIGPRGTGPTTVIRDSVRSIIQAMDKTGTRRFVQVSGSIVTDDGESPYLRYLIKPVARRTFLRHVCADMRAGEDEIRRSDLDWTILRPPALTGKAAVGTYRTAIDRNLPHGFNVSRADLAACILALLDDPATVHRHVSIAN